jgi:D-beta-D-heptose 7-phosphate kinase/D-beta-D-heptose 1-phosphate adenosyltransferase
MEYTLNIARKPNIIVIGDIFLDHTYHNNSVTRLANEAPIPVYKHSREVWSLGGAGNVIANLASMGCATLYAFGRVSPPTDSHTSHILSLLEKYNTNNQLLYDDSVPTIVKNRYYCGKTLLFRHDQEQVSQLSLAQEDVVIERISAIIKDSMSTIDCIVFSDYSKGFLTNRLCQTIIGLARSHKIFTCVDPKNDPNKYIGCSLIKPNRAETYKLFGIQIDGSDTKHAHVSIHETLGCEASVITLSEHGATLFSQDSTDVLHCANQPMDVIDVTGAGDIVCATLAYLYTIHENKHEILKLANALAMISVGHLGSYILQPRDFVKCRSMLHTNKRMDVINLRRIIDVLRVEKHTSVFTNGCFDIIHVGHLDLLKRCREMGDAVIVGLNSDASIARLKGPERPIMVVEKRIAFLSALEFVDYVVVFEEDTPAELLSQLHPTILVKGGDYLPEQIVGREFVNEVRIVPFVDGYSSTSVIRTIRDRH